MEARVDVKFLWVSASHEADCMNQTTVLVNSREAWPTKNVKLSMDTLNVGDTLEVTIPSGTLNVTVDFINQSHVFAVGEWSGKAGGLRGGHCACLEWKTQSGTVTESSALPAGWNIPYLTYESVRELCDSFPAAEKPGAMRQIFEVLGRAQDYTKCVV